MLKRILPPYIQSVALKYPILTLRGPRQSEKATLIRMAFHEKPYIKPTWEVRTGSVMTAFLSSFFFITEKSPEELVGKSRPESLEDTVLDLLKKGPLSKSELSRALGHKSISGALKKTLISLLKQGGIAYTIAGKPNSRHQKYKLTEKPSDYQKT